MQSERGLGAAAVAFVLVASIAQGAWQPQSDEWGAFRGGLTHTGSVTGTSLFLPGVGGPAKVKWSVEVDHPVLYPPSVADLDRNGVKEVVVTPTDIKTQVGPPPDVNFLHQVEALGGANGNTQWTVTEANSFALFNGATIVDLDGDNNAEVLYFAGNPLTGTSATNKAVALEHNGNEKWRFADTLEWGANQHPVGIVTGLQAGNLDNDATNEALLGVILADILIMTGNAGPNCPNPNAQKIIIEGSNIRYVVHAIDGEDASPSNSWKKAVNPGFLASTPAVVDVNGDGKAETVWGSGAPEGILIPSCSAEVTVDGSAVDNRVFAIDGANPPNTLWEKSFEDPVGVDRPMAATPLVAGTTAGGDPIVAFLIPVPDTEPVANDPNRNILIALNGRTGETLWKKTIRPATIVPIAAADLNDDGQPEIIVQTSNRLATFKNQDGSDFWSQGVGDFRGKTFARSLTAAGVAVGDIDSDGVPEIVSILDGTRDPAGPKAALLVVNGETGALEWTFDLLQDDVIGGPVLADVDGDDSLLEIIVGGGSFTLGDGVDHTGQVIVLEPNAPDLSVTNVEVLGNKVKGDEQTVRATVSNPGTRDAVDSHMRLLVGGVAVGADKIVTIAAGGTSTVDFSWTPAAAGAQTVKVAADPDGALPELVETNNDKSVTVTILKRFDLQITAADVTFNPVQPVLGDSVTVTGVVKNVGEVATPQASVLRFEEAGLPLQEDKTIPVLNPGQSSSLAVTFTVQEERTHHFVVTADPAGALAEEREDNNVAAKDLDILVVRPDYRVAPADVSFSNPNPAVGDTITITVRVHNDGNQDAPATTMDLTESGVDLGPDLNVPAIPEGGFQDVQTSFTILEEREHSFAANVDPGDLVDEFDELNNAATKTLQVNVVRPDFRVAPADITFSDDLPAEGETVTITVVVHNDGNTASPASTAHLEESGVSLGPDVSVPAIPDGGTATIEQDFTIGEEREHTFTVTVDPADVVAEFDETNNEASQALQVKITRPDLVAVSLLADPGIQDPGGVVDLSALFRNDGDRAVAAFVAEFFDGADLVGAVPGPAIPVGGTATVLFDWTATEPRDVHELGVVGIVLGPEPNKANNAATTSVVVGTLQVGVVMTQATYDPSDLIEGTVTTTFTGTSTPVPGTDLVVEVFYTLSPGGMANIHTMRARLQGTTDDAGQFAFVVPPTLLGQVDVCVAGTCVVDGGTVMGQGVNVPGQHDVIVHADRLGFDFHGLTTYTVAP